MRLIVVLVLLGILASLGSALWSLSRPGDKGDRTLRALTWRISLSLGLFALLFVMYWLGLIEPNASPA